MTYYVLAVDGKTYGPVDVEGLKTWHREGRLVASTRLREAATGRLLSASDVPDLHALLGGPAAAAYGLPEPNRCPYCGGAMIPGHAQCVQCGTALGAVYQPRHLITGSLQGDRIFGFVVGLFSWLLYGLGGLAAIIVYFAVRPNYPIFARSLGFGLAAAMVAFFGLVALFIAGLWRLW